MKSTVVSLSGKSPSLSTDLHPEIELDERFEYSCCLLDFSIYNISLNYTFAEKNSFDYISEVGESRKVTIHKHEYNLPYIMSEVEQNLTKNGGKTQISFDKYKMKFRIQSSAEINLRTDTSIAEIIGYEPQKIEKNTIAEAENSVGQFDVETIRVNCDLVDGSFHDGIRTHALHEFHPKPVSNYKMFEQPQHLIYLPVIRQRINNINVTVTDQDGKLLNLKGGEIHCRLNIKRGHKKC